MLRYAGRTHALYDYQERQWFGWCETNRLDPFPGIQRAHIAVVDGDGLGDLPAVAELADVQLALVTSAGMRAFSA